MNYQEEIAKLKGIIRQRYMQNEHTENALHNFQEIKNELLMRRSQVSILNKEIDSANLKILELNRTLEVKKSSLRETEFNLKLAMDKVSRLEGKMTDEHEAYVRMKLKEDMMRAEVNILNDNIQKMAIEKQHLSRQVDDLNSKLKYYSNLQSDFQQWQNKMRTMFTEVTQDMEKLECEQSSLQNIANKMSLIDNFKNLNQQLTSENTNLRLKCDKLENNYIQVLTKCENLTSLLKTNFNFEKNSITQMKLLQWEKRYKDLQRQNEENEKLLQKLNEILSKELATSADLLIKYEQLEIRNAQLEKELVIKKIKPEIDW